MPEPPPPDRAARRGADHVVLLDGTMSSLDPGEETNIGLTFKLLQEVRAQGMRLSLYYEPGLQWQGWHRLHEVVQGRGLNRQIRRAYGFLASRYRPGDRIWLMGYSRGAYAVRSLGGLIDRVGLLRREEATERNIVQAYRHYQFTPGSEAARRFAAAHCHPQVAIEMIGVYDTVKALGWRLPVVWKFSEVNHVFHDHHLGPSVRRGYHALALDETRAVFEPVLWESRPGWSGHLEQVWFRGAHGDVGGQLSGDARARPLSNIPLVWMLSKAEAAGLPLPPGWAARFPTDPAAPMVGNWRGWGKIFLLRHARTVGRDPSERIHPSALPVPPADLAGVPAE